LGPLGDDGKVIGVIFIAVAFGIALRSYRYREVKTVEDIITLAFDAFIVVLHWIIDVIPLAIFGIVASIIGTKGFADFQALGMFVVAVLIALFLQAAYYLVRVGLGSWVRPLDLLRHTRDALRDGLFHCEFHCHHASDIFVPARPCWFARTVGQHGFTGRCEL
jgi:DAACS family dicarboxylate/amino acid:cation (Na+ or H+) symporter